MSRALGMVAALAVSSVGLGACSVALGRSTGGAPAVASAAGTEAPAAAASDATAAAPSAPPPSSCRAPAARDRAAQPPALSSPASPWLAVAGDRPAPLPLDEPSAKFANVIPREDRETCDAAHDHCLRECTWLALDARATDKGAREAWVGHFRPDGMFVTPFTGGELERDYVAYRTVPATKRLLRPGVLVAVRDWNGSELPQREVEAFGNWKIGTLASVDWEDRILRVVDEADPFRLSAARIVVLQYSKGGKVALAPGLRKDEIVVAADEVLAPQVATRAKRDPWSQVDKAGQPLAVTDDRPLDTVVTSCGAAQDHCLRAWVWFATDGIAVQPARFDGKTFTTLRNGRAIAGPAYRTEPATAETLHVGAEVFIPEMSLGSEESAHTMRWYPVKVVSIDAAAGTFTATGNAQPIAIDRARIPALIWLAGSPAEKL